MPRPLRLKYEDAYYHVMNRDSGRQTIFHDAEYYSALINTMVEAHQRFGAISHAYCLMGNQATVLGGEEFRERALNKNLVNIEKRHFL